MDAIYRRMIELGVKPFDLRNTVYKYRSLEQTREIIKSNTIYFPTGEELKKLDKNELTPFLINNLTEEQKNRYLRKIGPDLEHKSIDEIFHLMVSFFQNNAGVFCVGKSPLNQFLWNCFGEENRGVCLGLDASRFVRTNLAFNVRYVDLQKTAKTQVYDYLENDVSYDVWQWLCTKEQRFIEEDEVRILTFDRWGSTFLPKEALIELVFGKGTTKQEQDEILQLLREYQYPVRRIGYFNSPSWP